MVLTYDWVMKKLNYDIENICGNQTIFALINEEGYYSNYFLEADKAPSPYELQLYNQSLKKLTLKELHTKVHCPSGA
ncbi:hypothetical protein ACFP65_06100 [Marinilactibacillus sp. GCM10026970]|uniref:hypothetical protein n=1 Tax=Marinilactibacillus sp. GCM10026970 TaxID=3252642 RepID=UPI0036129B64